MQVVRGFTFTATVQSTNNKPSGDVVFQNGDSILATVALDDMGSAVYSSASLGPGVHYISAAYSGTIGLAGSVSSVLVETIPAEVPDFSMTRSPADLPVLSSGSVSSQVIVQPMHGFNQSVGLTCSTGTAQLTCSPAIGESAEWSWLLEADDHACGHRRIGSAGFTDVDKNGDASPGIAAAGYSYAPSGALSCGSPKKLA